MDVEIIPDFTLDEFPVLAYCVGTDENDKPIWRCPDCLSHYERFYETITKNTVQYEQWPGELIPLEGVYCCDCGVECYAPLESEV